MRALPFVCLLSVTAVDNVISVCCGIFFFQAEDGIRDLVRSRGLGDVYKRQVLTDRFTQIAGGEIDRALPALLHLRRSRQGGAIAVSYTHLTLPTSDLV